MPSDPRTAAALTALQAPREVFTSALAATLEELRVYLDTHQSEVDDRLAVLTAELGPVGSRHIDVTRLASVLAAEPAVSPPSRAVMAAERAQPVPWTRRRCGTRSRMCGALATGKSW